MTTITAQRTPDYTLTTTAPEPAPRRRPVGALVLGYVLGAAALAATATAGYTFGYHNSTENRTAQDEHCIATAATADEVYVYQWQAIAQAATAAEAWSTGDMAAVDAAYAELDRLHPILAEAEPRYQAAKNACIEGRL